ncbi:MAG: 50S ribosomal protein L35 [Planctomycetales bacterium]
MPKQKTHKGIKKRFKLTAKGKAKYRSPNRGHIMSSKSPKRKRDLRRDGVVSGAPAKVVAEGLLPCS